MSIAKEMNIDERFCEEIMPEMGFVLK